MKKNHRASNSRSPDNSWHYRHSQLMNASHLDSTRDLSVSQQPDPDQLVSWIDGLKNRVDSTLDQQERELQKLRISSRERSLKEQFRHQVSSEAFDKLGEVLSYNAESELIERKDSPYPEQHISEEEEHLHQHLEESSEEASEDDVVEILSSEDNGEEEEDEEQLEEEEEEEEDEHLNGDLHNEEERLAQELSEELSRYAEDDNIESHGYPYAESEEEVANEHDEYSENEYEDEQDIEQAGFEPAPAYQIRNGRPRLTDVPIVSTHEHEDYDEEEELESDQFEEDVSNHERSEEGDQTSHFEVNPSQAGPDEDDAIIILSTDDEADKAEEQASSDAESDREQYPQAASLQYGQNQMGEDYEEYSEVEGSDDAEQLSEQLSEQSSKEDMEDENDQFQFRQDDTGNVGDHEEENESTNYFATANDSLEQDDLFASIASKALTSHVLDEPSGQLDRVLSDYLADVESDGGPLKASSQNADIMPIFNDNKVETPVPEKFDLGTSSAAKKTEEDASEGSLADSDDSEQYDDPQPAPPIEDAKTTPVFKTVTPDSPRTTLRQLKATERKFGVKLNAVKELEDQLGLLPSESSEDETDSAFVDAPTYHSDTLDDQLKKAEDYIDVDSASFKTPQEVPTHIPAVPSTGQGKVPENALVNASMDVDDEQFVDARFADPYSNLPTRPKATVFTSGNLESDSTSEKEDSDHFYESSSIPPHNTSASTNTDELDTPASNKLESQPPSSSQNVPDLGRTNSAFEFIKKAQKDPRHKIPISIGEDGQTYEMASCPSSTGYNVSLGEVASLNTDDHSKGSSRSVRAPSPHDSFASTITSIHHGPDGSHISGIASINAGSGSESNKTEGADREASAAASFDGASTTTNASVSANAGSDNDGSANASVQVNPSDDGNDSASAKAEASTSSGRVTVEATLNANNKVNVTTDVITEQKELEESGSAEGSFKSNASSILEQTGHEASSEEIPSSDPVNVNEVENPSVVEETDDTAVKMTDVDDKAGSHEAVKEAHSKLGGPRHIFSTLSKLVNNVLTNPVESETNESLNPTSSDEEEFPIEVEQDEESEASAMNEEDEIPDLEEKTAEQLNEVGDEFNEGDQDELNYEPSLSVQEPDTAEPVYVVFESNTIVEGVEAISPTEVEEPEESVEQDDVNSAVQDIVTEIFSQLEEESRSPTDIIEPEDEVEKVVEVFEETNEVIRPTRVDEFESMNNSPEPVESTVQAEDVEEPRGRKRAGEFSLFSSPAKKLKSIAKSIRPFDWFSSSQSSRSSQTVPKIPTPELEDVEDDSSEQESDEAEGMQDLPNEIASENEEEAKLHGGDASNVESSEDVDEADDEPDLGAYSAFLDTMEAVSNDSSEPLTLMDEEESDDIANDLGTKILESVKDIKHVEEVGNEASAVSEAENDEAAQNNFSSQDEELEEQGSAVQDALNAEVSNNENQEPEGAGENEIPAEGEVHDPDDESMPQAQDMSIPEIEVSSKVEDQVTETAKVAETDAKSRPWSASSLDALSELDDSVPTLPQFRIMVPTLERLAAEEPKSADITEATEASVATDVGDVAKETELAFDQTPQSVEKTEDQQIEPAAFEGVSAEELQQNQASDESVAQIFRILGEKAQERIEHQPVEEQQYEDPNKAEEKEATPEKAPQKRKRGRPRTRKYPITQEKPVVKGKRGRPPKNKAAKKESPITSPRLTRHQAKLMDDEKEESETAKAGESETATKEDDSNIAEPMQSTGPKATALKQSPRKSPRTRVAVEESPRKTRQSAAKEDGGNDAKLLSQTIDKLQAVTDDQPAGNENAKEAPLKRRLRTRNQEKADDAEQGESKVPGHDEHNVKEETNEPSAKVKSEPDVKAEASKEAAADDNHDTTGKRRSTRARRPTKQFDEENAKTEQDVPSSPVIKPEVADTHLSPAFDPQAQLSSPKKRGRPRKNQGAQASPSAEFSPPMPRKRTPSGSKWQLDSLDHPALRTRSKSPIKRTIQELSSDMEEEQPKRRRRNVRKVMEEVDAEEKKQEEEGRGRRRTRRG